MAFVDYDKVVLFGDSITEQSYEQTRGFGFGAALADAYRRKLEVLNRGFSGYNTAHALHVLPRFLPPASPECKIKLMTIFFGANDAVLPGLPQHIPLDTYRLNLQRLPRLVRSLGHDPAFILITPPPICEFLTHADDTAKGRAADGPQRLAVHTKKYVDAAVATAEDIGMPVVNLWQAFVDYAGGWKEGHPLPGSREAGRNEKLTELLRDGLHLNPKGYQIMYDEVLKTICAYFPELNPELLRFVYPYWNEAPKAEAETE